MIGHIIERWPDLIGGGAAYWLHHLMHKVWRMPAYIPRIARYVRR